jgi:hypothetical protein
VTNPAPHNVRLACRRLATVRASFRLATWLATGTVPTMQVAQ